MLRTHNFRRQHDDMLALVTEIQAKIQEGGASQAAAEIHSLLMKLTGKLKIHLAQEDRSLYPRIIESNNTSAANAAKHFQDEMSDLSSAYLAFAERWSTPSCISENTEDFTRESSAVFQALSKRIDRENRELYPLVDAM